MKRLLYSALAVLALSAARRPAAVTYTLNPASSRLTWTGHAEAGTYAPTGTLQLAPGSTLALAGPRAVQAARVVVDVRTLAHDNGQLQEHLRGADFFDVARYPLATFVLRRVAGNRAEGLLTLKGRTRPLTVPLTVTPLGADSVLVQGTAHLDRTQFGINYNSSSFFQNLGSYAIRNDFELAFRLRAGRQPAQ